MSQHLALGSKIIIYLFSTVVLIRCILSTTVPLSNIQTTYFQSDSVQVIRSTPKSTSYSANVVFNYTKSSIPTLMISYGSIDYDLNKVYTVGQSYLFSIHLMIGSLTVTGFSPVAEVLSPNQLNLVKYCYLAIDPHFPYFSYVTKSLFLSISPSYTISFNPNYPNSKIISFLWGLQMQLKSTPLPSTQIFDLQFTILSQTSSNIQIQVTPAITTFQSFQIKVSFLTIAVQNIPADEYEFIQVPITVSGTTYLETIVRQLESSKSVVMYGLWSFHLVAINGDSSPSLKMKLDRSIDGIISVENSLALQSLTYHAVVINAKGGCPPKYPIQVYNTTTSMNQCSNQCLQNQYMFFNQAILNYQCGPCPSQCVGCINSTFCIDCAPNLQVGEDGVCYLLNTFYNSSGVLKLCNQTIVNCLTCASDGSVCTQCLTSYALSIDGLTCSLCSSLFNENCDECTIDYCLSCKIGYVLQSTSACAIPGSIPPLPPTCTDINCSICDSANLTFCTTCVDTEIEPVDGRCIAQCGDGKIMSSQQCDDQNLQSLDGCSSNCMIQDGFQCDQALFLPTSKYFKSTCFYAKAITFDLIRILKVKNENKIQIQIKTPNVKVSSWTQIDFSKIFKFSGEAAQFIVSTSYQSSQNKNQKIQARRLLQNEDNQQYVTVTVEYNASMQNKELLLSIDPAVSSLVTFSKVSAFSSSFTVKSDDNEKVNFYSKDTYESANLILRLAEILGIATFAMIVLGLFVGNMMVPLDLCGVIQLSYFSLLNVGQLNPLFLALSGLKFSSGFNPSLSYSSPLEDPANVRQAVGIGMYSSMIDNFNISLVLVIVFLIVGAVLKLIARFLLKAQGTVDNVNKISSNLIGSSTFYLIVCFSYLMSVSIGICIKSGSSGIINIVLIAICLILMIAFAVFLIKYEKAQYFQKISQKIADFRRFYLVSGLGFRVVVGFSIALLMDSKIGGIIVCILCLLWIVVLIAKARPYKLTHMIRLISTLVLGLCVQIICCYQRFSGDDSEQQANLSLYSPVSVLVILYLAFFINLMFFVYSIKQIRCCSLQIEWQKVKKSSFSKINNSEEYNLLKDVEVKSQKQQKQKSQKNACLVQLSNLEINQNQNQSNPSAKKYDTYEDKSKGQKQQLTLIISSNFQQATESPKNRQLLNRQIKKQLKDCQISRQISRIEGNGSKLMKPCQKQQNLSLDGSSYESDVNIYKTLKKQNFKQGSALESGQSTPKYKHALPNKFCTFEQI